MKHHSDALPELLPKQYTNGYALKEALHYIHEPPVDANMIQLAQGSHPAQQRLILKSWSHIKLVFSLDVLIFVKLLHLLFRVVKCLQKAARSFTFSNDQRTKRVSKEILNDLKQHQPMLRLVQGDVGAGKTLVAAVAACHALEADWQVALMAPTEILAEQHYLNFKRWFEPLGITVAWLSGKQKGKRGHTLSNKLKKAMLN